MTSSVIEPGDGSGQENQETQQPSAPVEGEKLGEGGKKAIQAERDARKAADEARKAAEAKNAELQAQLDALNTEKLSDLEKAQLETKTAQEVAAKATKDALRYKYAAKHGISEEDAGLFLTGETEEAVSAQAERLAGRLKEQARENESEALADPTQGGSGRPPAPNVQPGVDRMAAAFEAEITS